MTRRPAAPAARIFLVALALALAPAGPVQARIAPQIAARRAQARLHAVQVQIARVARQVEQSRIEQSRLTQALRTTEQSAGAARAALASIRRQRAALAARRTRLAARRRRRQADLDRTRRLLAGELRAAYLIGQQGPVRLLLEQGGPSLMQRMFAYYSYFGRQRARVIGDIEADLQHIAQLDRQMQASDAQLAGLEQQRQNQLSALEHATLERRQVLASIAARTRTRAERLLRLRREQQGLQALIAALRRAEARMPRERPPQRFARLQGHLPWPVAGRLIARFGQPRAGGLRWDGDLIATRLDAPVRAVAPGRVIFADWLAGLGLLIVVDHGGGYMSLYGHNDHLYARVGQQVAAGQLIAAAGDSGGASRPELYFGIRHGTQPVDPRVWLERHAR
ncbi:MAG: murein hydrolase activator EnvC family protein [Steroidobacteraceae bacterium]